LLIETNCMCIQVSETSDPSFISDILNFEKIMCLEPCA
jgi:hypothetical protein